MEVLRDALKHITVCSIYIPLVLLLPNKGLASFLSGSFETVSSSDHIFGTLENQRIDSGSCVECALRCLRKLADAPKCSAHACHPLDRKCDLYTTGTSQTLPPGVDVFMFKVTDIFHTISINQNVFTIYVSSEEKPFDEARAHCNNLGGYLLQFDSQDESEAVGIGMSGQTGVQLYIGATDIELEGHWVTDREGSLLDTSVWVWVSGEPNNAGSNEDCADIWIDHMKLNDIPCTHPRRYMCEKDA